MKHLKTLTEWTSWHDDLYEPGENWADRVAQMREEQKRLEIQAKRKKKQVKARPPRYKSKIVTSPKWKEEQKAKELEYELKEGLSNIEIIYIGEQDISNINLIRNAINFDDYKILTSYSTKVGCFEIRIPHQLDISIYDIFEKNDSINPRRIKPNSNYLFVDIVWLDMGNGLTSIAIEEEYGTYSKHCIYSGEKALTEFLSKDLPAILDAERYNL